MELRVEKGSESNSERKTTTMELIFEFIITFTILVSSTRVIPLKSHLYKAPYDNVVTDRELSSMAKRYPIMCIKVQTHTLNI